jgi:hypothetical protein
MNPQHYLLSKELYPKLFNSIITIRYLTSSITTTTNNNNNHHHDSHNYEKNSSTHKRYGLFGIKNLYDPDDFQKLTSKAIENIQSIRKFIAQTNTSSRSSSLSLSSSSPSSSSSSLSSIINTNNNSSNINVNSSSSCSSGSSSNNNQDEKISIHPSLCLLLLDEISCQLCGIIDVAELCRNIHTSDKYKFKAEATFDQLSKVIHQLNNDDTLYQRLISIIIHHINDHIDDNDKKDGRNNDDDDNDGHNDCIDKYVLTEEERLFVMDMKREFESEGKI